MNIRNEYNRLCIVGGVKLGTPTKKYVVNRPRTWRALQKQWGKLQLSINHFRGDYVRSSYVVRASGPREEDFMADAHKFYVAKHLEVFTHIDECRSENRTKKKNLTKSILDEAYPDNGHETRGLRTWREPS